MSNFRHCWHLCSDAFERRLVVNDVPTYHLNANNSGMMSFPMITWKPSAKLSRPIQMSFLLVRLLSRSLVNPIFRVPQCWMNYSGLSLFTLTRRSTTTPLSDNRTELEVRRGRWQFQTTYWTYMRNGHFVPELRLRNPFRPKRKRSLPSHQAQ